MLVLTKAFGARFDLMNVNVSGSCFNLYTRKSPPLRSKPANASSYDDLSRKKKLMCIVKQKVMSNDTIFVFVFLVLFDFLYHLRMLSFALQTEIAYCFHHMIKIVKRKEYRAFCVNFWMCHNRNFISSVDHKWKYCYYRWNG